MDPRKLFADERLTAVCVYCGGEPSTRDHVPSRVLLDEPLPPDLPVVPACEACNNGFSLDEQYLACFLDCAITGSVDPSSARREKVKRILTEQPALGSLIAVSRREDKAGNAMWEPDLARVRNVILKLARGHFAYECSEPQLAKPLRLAFVPLRTMTAEEMRAFETPPGEDVLPELGSRAFLRATIVNSEVLLDEGWHVVQEARYQYLVSYSGRTVVRFVLSEYLACEVAW